MLQISSGINSKSTYLKKAAVKNETIVLNLRKHWELHIMVIPGIIFLLIFKYIPLGGILIAFKDYGIFKGFAASPWVGFKHFEAFFQYSNFSRVFTNTLLLGVYKSILTFPFPILLALLINEINNIYYKKTIQTVFYIPHFFSWVIIAGLTFDVLSGSGVVNMVRQALGLETIRFMQQPEYFRFIVFLTHLWRDAGWGTIVILAAIIGIDPSIYQAAYIDGAGKLKQIIYITIPLLMPTVLILFLLQIGQFLEVGFDHVYNLLTPMTYSVGDIIDTYVYRVGVIGGQYSASTAIGVFQSLIGFLFIVIFNKLANKFSESGGIW